VLFYKPLNLYLLIQKRLIFITSGIIIACFVTCEDLQYVDLFTMWHCLVERQKLGKRVECRRAPHHYRTRRAPLLVLISHTNAIRLCHILLASWIDAVPPVHNSPSEGRPLPKHVRSAVGAEAEAAFRKKQCTPAPAAAKMNLPHSEPCSRSPRNLQLHRDRPIIVAAAVEGEVEAYSASHQPDNLTIGNRTDALANSGYRASNLSSHMSSSPRYAASIMSRAGSQTNSKPTRNPSLGNTLRDLSMLIRPITYVSSPSRLPPKTFFTLAGFGGHLSGCKEHPSSHDSRMNLFRSIYLVIILGVKGLSLNTRLCLRPKQKLNNI